RRAELPCDLLVTEGRANELSVSVLGRHEDRNLRIALHRRGRRSHRCADHSQACAACLIRSGLAPSIHDPKAYGTSIRSSVMPSYTPDRVPTHSLCVGGHNTHRISGFPMLCCQVLTLDPGPHFKM